MANIEVEYQVQQENLGWSEWFKNGAMAGVIGQALRVEAIRFRLLNKDGLDIYLHGNPHLENIGWAGFVPENEICGTVGEARKMEGVQLQLVGNDADKFSVQYRTHSQNQGTMSFTRDGGLAGTEGGGYRIEGIQILITEKDVDLSQYEVTSFRHFDPVVVPEPAPVTTGRLGLKYFNEDTEFLCEDGCGFDVIDQIKVMADAAREAYGHALVISSGGRCAAWNAAVGGIQGSNHTKGTAIDVYAPGRMSRSEVDVLAAVMQSVGFHTISYHDELFVHGDLDAGYNWDMN